MTTRVLSRSGIVRGSATSGGTAAQAAAAAVRHADAVRQGRRQDLALYVGVRLVRPQRNGQVDRHEFHGGAMLGSVWPMAIVEVNRLTKNFGRLRALDQVTFTVEEGEVFGFLGPNGAGKTTAIRIMLGLLHPDGGSVKIGGYDCWTEHGRAARLFGATLEQPGLYGYLSGRDNLRLFAHMLGQVDEKQITDLLALVGMTERADDKVKRYSMGMRQRLALAQALLGKPRLLVLDEPTNGLDPNGIHGLRLLLRRLATEQELTIFFSSHLLSEVEELCDRVVVLHRGEVRAAGPLSELMNVKGFVYRIDVSDVARALEVINGMEGARAERGTLKDSVTVHTESELGRLIIHALVSAGIGVDQLVRTQRGLEDIYIQLTGAPQASPLSDPAGPPAAVTA